MRRNQVPVGGAKNEREDSQMEVLHVQFPFNELARKRKLVYRGLCCLAGFCWRHAHLVFEGDKKWQEQGERNESEDKCLTGAVRAIRLRPNRATPTASIEISKLDSRPITDGGTTYGGAEKRACQ